MERVSGIDEKRPKPQKHAKTHIKTRENAPIRIEKFIFCYQKCYQRKTARVPFPAAVDVSHDHFSIKKDPPQSERSETAIKNVKGSILSCSEPFFFLRIQKMFKFKAVEQDARMAFFDMLNKCNIQFLSVVAFRQSQIIGPAHPPGDRSDHCLPV